MPAPSEVARAFVLYHSTLLGDTLATMRIALAGLGAAVAVAALLAILILHVKFLQSIVFPFIIFLEAMPKIALAPLFILWFGIGSESKIVLAALLAFFPVTINLTRGMQNVDSSLLDVFQVLNASRWKTLRFIRFPSALPSFYDGLRIAVPASLVGAVLGEFIASERGLGHRMLLSTTNLRLDLVFAILLTLGCLSIAGFYVLQILERFTIPWKRPTS
jgi:NitT/TauT family transport system permease protein